MGLAVSFDDRTSLSTTVAGPRQRRLALAVVLISTVLFLIAAPFAKVPLRPVAAFIPVYETALFLIDLITAVLLFGQFAILRSRALLVLASGYLFTSTMTVVHALSFPGLFSPTGLLGAGPQTTVWLYVFWHVGFALFVIAFALLRDDTSAPDGPDRDPRVAIVSRIFFVLILTGSLTLFATAGQHVLPAIMQGNRYGAGAYLIALPDGRLFCLRLLFCCGAGRVACLICGLRLSCASRCSRSPSAPHSMAAGLISASTPDGYSGCWRSASCCWFS
jgi:hypothetical protein